MINEKYSRRDLSEQIKNVVCAVNENEVVFFQNTIKRDSVYAKIMFTSGTATGKSYTVDSHDMTSITVSDWGGTIPVLGDKFYIYWDLASVPASEFNNSIIVGSQLFHPTAKIMFPLGVVGLELRHCAADNVLPQSGLSITRVSTNKGIEKQNDMELWFVGLTDRVPSKPLREADYIELGLSTDPKDIPNTKQSISIVESTREAL